MNLREAAEKALEALIWEAGYSAELYTHKTAEAVKALRSALAEAEDPDASGLYHKPVHKDSPNARPAFAVRAEAEEPVDDKPYLYVYEWETPLGVHREFCAWGHHTHGQKPTRTVPLYTHPPRREPLTDEQIAEVRRELDFSGVIFMTTSQCKKVARVFERAHGIGESKPQDSLTKGATWER